jgi:hypothetical protein
MRISGILIGLWITMLFVAGDSIAQESFVPKLEPVPVPGIAGAVPPILENSAVSQLLFDGISPTKAEAVLSRIPENSRRAGCCTFQASFAVGRSGGDERRDWLRLCNIRRAYLN